MNTAQLKLPYEELPPLASRDIIRANSTAGKQTCYILFEIIQIREGFNIRIKPENITKEQWLEQLHIPELANDLVQNGLQDALRGDMSRDGKSFFLTDGHRRYLAIEYILENGLALTQPNGKSWNLVEVITNPNGTTEKDRLFYMLATDKKLPYKNTEVAAGVRRAKEVFGMSSEEIASQMGKSRQWVDNMLLLSAQPESIQQAVDNGQISMTAAVTLARNVKDPAERETIIAEAVSAGHTIQVKDVDEGLLKRATNTFNGIGSTENTNSDTVTNPAPKSASTITETKAALDAEMDSHKTEAKFKETRPKNDQIDALPKVDFKKEKTEAEMALNEVVGLLDKMNVMADSLPTSMKGMRDDYQRMCAICVRKVEEAKEIIKKAADER